MVSYICFVLYLYFHACIARPLVACDKKNFTQRRQFPCKEGFVTCNNLKARYGDSTIDITQLGNHNSPAAEETETIIGGRAKTLHTRKMLPQATATEIWRRERWTLESEASKAEEHVSSKNSDTAENAVVMDYAQPHRKPPIHNKGT